MSELKVSDTAVPSILEMLKRGEWLVPEFQRDFVWSTEQVSALVQSILEARPIGMVTLWEQSEDGQLPVESISIPDHDSETKKPVRRFFSTSTKSAKRLALLDGRQRCTAIAMAFGGFRARHGLYKHSGRYYLNVCEQDPRKRVKFFKETDVRRLKLDVDANCIGLGLFPLASNVEGEAILSQWMRYLQALEKPENYPDGNAPSSEELSRRNRILQDAFQGIVETKMAVYTVPEKYSLGDICEIFETLNTTGTKVSTVDLIHSWLYNDTFKSNPFLLREWIEDLGAKDGAIGWSDKNDRPELIAQFVTACYVALEQKPAPRPVGRGKPSMLTSIKAADLLGTPAQHWDHVTRNEELFAADLGDAQKCVAGGYFPYTACPYPVSLAIYVGLRWHGRFDFSGSAPWAIDELNALFRAFFWRNALTRRYDQGFLSQIGADIVALKRMLHGRADCRSSGEWADVVEPELQKLIESRLPSRDDLVDLVTVGRLDGAIQKALLLPMLGGVRKDLFESGISLSFPSTIPVEIHHIYPRDWCRNQQRDAYEGVLNEDVSGRDFVNSTANLMPLSRTSNNAWKRKYPGLFLNERSVGYDANRQILESVFINRDAFELLKAEYPNPGAFWTRRAALIATDLEFRMKITL